MPQKAIPQHPYTFQPLGCLQLSGGPCQPPSGPASPGTPGTHLKEALPLAQAAPLQVPKVNVGFPTGDEHGGICGVEGSHQHGLVGAL